ncbi:MAG: 50S ribosomal protein L11 methyltransferase [Syntrophobacteraceae bacterium]|jgi:ribosomal protein L11 methyltransferase|nr:50S ribosomal protein L11 methyltransferase [Syntrophobacteraceae bacterium]
MKIEDSKRLFVYECLAPGLSAREPVAPTLVAVWPEPPCTYFFFESPEDELMETWVQMQPGFELLSRYEIDYGQWQQVATGDQRVGSFIIPGPAPEPNASRSSGAKTLIIDPGLVFGSGLHPTTRGCLLAIEKLFGHHRIKEVMDFGTGTGILAIACALLGAGRVVAIDCNPLAVRVAHGNFMVNGVSGIIHPVVADDPGVVGASLDLILMNIEWPCLTKTISQPHWRRHSLAVLSGFLESQWPTLSSLLPATHVPIHEESHDGWRTVALEAVADRP